MKLVAERDPDYSEVYYELGFCYENYSQLDKALQSYDKFLELDPYNPNGWYNRGIVLVKMNKLEQGNK